MDLRVASRHDGLSRCCRWMRKGGRQGLLRPRVRLADVLVSDEEGPDAREDPAAARAQPRRSGCTSSTSFLYGFPNEKHQTPPDGGDRAQVECANAVCVSCCSRSRARRSTSSSSRTARRTWPRSSSTTGTRPRPFKHPQLHARGAARRARAAAQGARARRWPAPVSCHASLGAWSRQVRHLEFVGVGG
jgi:hypothetical protein